MSGDLEQVEVAIEVTAVHHVTVEVDKSDPNWAEEACDKAARNAWRLTPGDFVSARPEVVDE